MCSTLCMYHSGRVSAKVMTPNTEDRYYIVQQELEIPIKLMDQNEAYKFAINKLEIEPEND